MNVLSRPLFDMPPEMVEGTGITSMGMEEGPPSSMGEQEARDIGGMIAGNLAGRIEQTELGIDGAEDELGMMNALRGEEQSEEEYRDELAELVGPKDAAATPNSVLALIQPTLAMVQMAEQMGTQGGGTGGIGDLGGMGDLGDMSALMGGMGGDSLGGLATMLPQDQPMPMEMMAVEENIAGVMPDQEMPTQMFALGGAALSAPQIKEMLMSLQPAVPQTPEKGFWESALQIGAPAIAAGLMGEPGREWRTGLGMLAKSSSAALQQEEKRKLDNERLLYASEAGAGTKAGTAWLAQQTAADLAANTLAKAKAAGSNLTPYQKLMAQYVDPNTPENQKELLLSRMSKLTEPSKGTGSDLTPFQKLLAQRDHPDTTPALREDIQLRIDKLTLAPRSAADIAAEGLLSSERTEGTRLLLQSEKRAGDANDKTLEGLSETSTKLQEISNLSNIASSLTNQFNADSFGNRAMGIASIGSIASKLGVPDEIVNSAMRGLGVKPEDLSIAQVLQSVRQKLTLQYTSSFPGNLNQTEVLIAQRATGEGLITTSESQEILAKIQQTVSDRANKRLQIFNGTRAEMAQNAKDNGTRFSEEDFRNEVTKRLGAFSKEVRADQTLLNAVADIGGAAWVTAVTTRDDKPLGIVVEQYNRAGQQYQDQATDLARKQIALTFPKRFEPLAEREVLEQNRNKLILYKKEPDDVANQRQVKAFINNERAAVGRSLFGNKVISRLTEEQDVKAYVESLQRQEEQLKNLTDKQKEILNAVLTKSMPVYIRYFGANIEDAFDEYGLK